MQQDNVISLSSHRPDPAAQVLRPANDDTAALGSTMPHPTMAMALRFARVVLGTMGTTFRYTTFFLLRWIRGPVTLLLGLASGLSLLAGLLVWFGYAHNPDQRSALLPYLLGVGFSASVLRFAYDWVLYRLSPTPGLI